MKKKRSKSLYLINILYNFLYLILDKYDMSVEMGKQNKLKARKQNNYPLIIGVILIALDKSLLFFIATVYLLGMVRRIRSHKRHIVIKSRYSIIVIFHRNGI